MSPRPPKPPEPDPRRPDDDDDDGAFLTDLEAPAQDVVFQSREREPSQFDVMGISSIRRANDGKLEWHVPADRAGLFVQHHHCVFGRIVRAA